MTALSEAVTGQKTAYPAPPPPAKKDETVIDEASISSITAPTAASFETDILPADQADIGESKPEPQAGMMHLRPIVVVPKQRKKQAPPPRSVGRILLMIIVLAMVAAAVLAFYFIIKRR